ncbi:hypothetical protein Hypma_014310 [Hypsizygus marmoreus]|uniref:Uncharacterized protein n=1 Tax=Hypsizygus marmoreus TaxID=39966 RepID=A0A369JEA8_HYPMA|nr:hypothetical protein Hypma_014310 [Hypsizygus marmoreus]
MTWFRTWDRAGVMNVADNDLLVLITLAASIMVFTALVGTSGVPVNSRPILAIYAVLLWPSLVSLLSVGYVSYKRATFSPDHKPNLSWSQYYTPLGRLMIQDSLRCSGGFYDAFHEGTPSKSCYPRTSLPGCKGLLCWFEQENLFMIWSAAFAFVLSHLINILISLLCANHLTKTFGNGITPQQCRLTSADVRVDADKIVGGLDYVETGPKTAWRPSSNGWFEEERWREVKSRLLGGCGSR